MANSCDVEMTIVGKREGLLKIADLFDELNAKVKELREKGESVYYDMYILGEIMNMNGGRGRFYDTDTERIRKEIEENIEDDGYSSFDMSYEGAWAEQLDFHQDIEEMFEDYDVQCMFRATELGCDYCVRNSEDYYPEEYLVDVYAGKASGMELCLDIIKAVDYIESLGVEIEHKSHNDFDELSWDEKEKYIQRLEKIIDGKLKEYNQNAEDEGSDNYIYLHKYEYVG